MKRLLSYEYSPQEFYELIKEAVREVISENSSSQFNNKAPPREELDILSSKQVCDLLHISAPTLIAYRKSGKIKGKRISGKIFYLKTEIEKFLTK